MSIGSAYHWHELSLRVARVLRLRMAESLSGGGLVVTLVCAEQTWTEAVKISFA